MFKKIKKLFCKIGWHSFSYDLVEIPEDPLNTGIRNRYKCKWCGGIGLVDSQGNLFAVEDVCSEEKRKIKQ